MIVAGVLSGTSLDGIDVAIVDLRPAGVRYAIQTLAFETVPFAPDLRARLRAAFPPAPAGALEVSALHAAVGDAFGAAVARVAAGRRLDLVASHGITLAHDGAAHCTLQIGDAFRIRERTHATVAFDFRAADTAAHGQGAPLVPYLDALLFADAREYRVAINLGGIANLTLVPPARATEAIVAFDSGPANMPIDEYVRSRGLHPLGYDADGALAARGSVDARLLDRLLEDPYFAAAPPKSTGRETFGAAFIALHAAALDALEPADALATLTALCVRSLSDAIGRIAPPNAMLIVSGGGVRNHALIAGLRAALPGSPYRTSAEFGIDPGAKEAVLFALLGYELLRGRPANVPNATGARGPRLLGALAPLALDDVMAAVRREEKR